MNGNESVQYGWNERLCMYPKERPTIGGHRYRSDSESVLSIKEGT